MTVPSGSSLHSCYISAVVLTLNEEINIERCIHSLSWADEIVVLDSRSTDRTVELAMAAGARVVEHRQVGIYRNADQRNWALEYADLAGDWILFVDADEVIPPELAGEIRRRCLDKRGPDAYQLAPKYLFWGRWMRHSMRYPVWHDRLLRRGRATFAGGVWEHFSPDVDPGRIAIPYIHYGNSKGFNDWLERHIRYSNWDAAGIIEYLSTGDARSFETLRRLRSRELAARFWRFRPLVRFFVMFVLRRGFLDGPEAFIFCLRYALYEYMTVEKVIEERRRRAGLPL
jgi:glycosyltransferase involved in cell wall biosynthesis